MSGEKKETKQKSTAGESGSQASQESTESTVSNSAYMPLIPADTGSPPDFSRLTPSPPLEETELFAASSSTSSTSNSTSNNRGQVVKVSGSSSTLFATPKADSKLFCFSLSHAVSLYPNIDKAITESKGKGAVWNRLKDLVTEGKLLLEAHPRIKEIIMGLINAGHQVAIFTGINHRETEAIVKGFLNEIVKLDKAVSEAMTITDAKSMKDESEVHSLKVSQVTEIRKKLKYPPARTVVVDAGVLRQLYTSQGSFYQVDDEQLLRDAGLVSQPPSTSSGPSMNGGGGGDGAPVSGKNSRKRKTERHDAREGQNDESGFGPG